MQGKQSCINWLESRLNLQEDQVYALETIFLFRRMYDLGIMFPIHRSLNLDNLKIKHSLYTKLAKAHY
jgi:hypothetical protein